MVLSNYFLPSVTVSLFLILLIHELVVLCRRRFLLYLVFCALVFLARDLPINELMSVLLLDLRSSLIGNQWSPWFDDILKGSTVRCSNDGSGVASSHPSPRVKVI
jgi:hypothetical protein